MSHESSFDQLFGKRVLVADGAMGTMIQSHDLSLDDFKQLEGCNEILNITRPDVILNTHQAYYEAGSDAVETNTFGANFPNLADYDIEDQILEIACAGAKIARQAADEYSTPGKPRFVLGSLGPGTKLPSLGHAPFAQLRDAYGQAALGLLEGGADALLVETVQDVLQAKAAIIGAQRAFEQAGRVIPIMAHVTVETTGTMLLGTEIAAALNALAPLGISSIGLNCATGPAEMSEHLRHLSAHSEIPVTVMPNAGLPQLGPDGAVYPLSAKELGKALAGFTDEFGLALVGGCCGTTPEHIKEVVDALGHQQVAERSVRVEHGVSSLYHMVPFKQDAGFLAIGERTNANGSKAFREAMVSGDYQSCIDIAKGQTRDGAHLLDVCVDYVGRDGANDVQEIVKRFTSSSTLPLVIDSTEPNVMEAGLELIGGRAVVNSVNFEDGDGPDSRYQRTMRLVSEHGCAVVALTIDEEGQARTAEHKVAIASRLIDDLTGSWGMKVQDIIVDTLTFPIATGQEETRKDGIATLDAIEELVAKYPGVNTTLGVSNVSFGLNPAARQVLNSVFLGEAVKRGLTSAIVHAAKILPLAKIPEDQVKVAMDLVYDRREFDAEGNATYDPLTEILSMFDGVDVASVRDERLAELMSLPLEERLKQRIIDGERAGLEEDLDAAMAEDIAPLSIINDVLLEGMKVVGERFGSGQMQLPFVLQSAETMKTAVAHLEPHIEEHLAAEGAVVSEKATLLLATVKGDVHDIGKNLVDIIVSNNGYRVVNIGIKKTINEILSAAHEHNADAIGMSGLLVKSTMVMKDNLAEINARGEGDRWPVILGGAALTRVFVEEDLAGMYSGHVRYARDAFEGLSLMDSIAKAKTSGQDLAEALPALRGRAVKKRVTHVDAPEVSVPARSDVARGIDIPKPPFWGTRVVKGIRFADYAAFLDERATFLGQWGLKPGRGKDGISYEELVETEGRPRLRYWMDRLHTESIMEAAVIYGYFPCYSENDDLVIVHDGESGTYGEERARITYPRQGRDRFLCIPDFFAAADELPEGTFDVISFQVATMGSKVSDVANELFSRNEYRDYMELHGLSVQLTEALAELWHARVRDELGLGDKDDDDLACLLKQGYQGSRYSFGYPACPSLEDRKIMMDLLDPSRIGIELSEELQLHPEQSTDAFVVHHPEAKYFNAT